MRLLIFSFITTLYCFSALASLTNKIQYAGEIGMLSFGVGYQVSDLFSSSILYGVTPKELTSPKLETFTLKNQLSLSHSTISRSMVNSYVGIAIYYVTGKGINNGQANFYPYGYYQLTSLRGLLFLGIELQVFKKIGLYFESGINDLWLINYWNNRGQINLKNYISLALGWNYYL